MTLLAVAAGGALTPARIDAFQLFAGQATVALLPTALGQWALRGWVRGVISGLGALDLVVAIQVAAELRRNMRIGNTP